MLDTYYLYLVKKNENDGFMYFKSLNIIISRWVLSIDGLPPHIIHVSPVYFSSYLHIVLH